MVIDTETKEGRLAVRADALHALGFCYDTGLDTFFHPLIDREPFIMTRSFVEDVPNEIFFREYCRFRDMLKKEPKNP